MTAPNRREAMATNGKTIDRLQYLEALYRQGYRSDTLARSTKLLRWNVRQPVVNTLTSASDCRRSRHVIRYPRKTSTNAFVLEKWAMLWMLSSGMSSMRCGNPCGHAWRCLRQPRAHGASGVPR